MHDINRSVLLVIILVIALPVLWGVAMMGAMGPGMMDGWDEGDGWSLWQNILAVLATLLVIGGLGMIGWWAFGHPARTRPSPRASEDSRDILDGRYARGELTREEYQQMRRDLEA